MSGKYPPMNRNNRYNNTNSSGNNTNKYRNDDSNKGASPSFVSGHDGGGCMSTTTKKADDQLALATGLTAKTQQLCLGLESGAADILRKYIDEESLREISAGEIFERAWHQPPCFRSTSHSADKLIR